METVRLLELREERVYNELSRKSGSGNGSGNNGGNNTSGSNIGDNENKKKKKKHGGNNNNNNNNNNTGTASLLTLNQSLLTARSDLSHLTHFTRTALQSEYSKLIVTLDPESEAYTALEEAVEYLFRDEERCVYFVEMCAVLKKIDVCKNVVGTLPLVKELQCDPSLIALLERELYLYAIHEAIKVRCKESNHHHPNCSHSGLSNLSPPKAKLLKYTLDTFTSSSIKVVDGIKRHYRKKSIKLHPDRQGEEYRPSFEKFTLAKDILLNDTHRLRYLQEMTHVASYYAQHVLEQSHEAWIGKHVASQPKEEVTKRIEGGLRYVCLKAPLVEIQKTLDSGSGSGGGASKNGGGKSNNTVEVKISVKVPRPMYEFYGRIHSIQIWCRSTHGAVHKWTISRKEIVAPLLSIRESELILPSQIYLGSRTLDEGYWEIQWKAYLDEMTTSPTNPENASSSDQDLIETQHSYSYTLTVHNAGRERDVHQFEYMEQQCKMIKGHLTNVLHRFHGCNGQNRQECHEKLVRGAKLHRGLKVAMERVQKSSSVYEELGALLNSSRDTIAQIELMNSRQEKKDEVKQFKLYVAEVLESEHPVAWMSKVSKEELQERGGDVNRLYQLFIEGKGKYALLMDSEMLHEASLRSDLFSAKQCKELTKQSKVVAVQEAKEEEESRAASERELAEEAARQKLVKEAELRLKWEMVGNIVSVSGLQSDVGKAMNGITARVIYYIVEKDRFEVECLGTGKRALLKRENLSVMYYGMPETSVEPREVQSEPRGRNKVVQNLPTPSSKSAVAVGKQAKTVQPNSTQANNDQKKSMTSRKPSVKQWTNGKASTSPTPPTDQKSSSSVRSTTPVTTASSTGPPPPSSTDKTIYVSSTVTKKLTGKRGRSKKNLEEQSGAKLDIQSGQESHGYVPVSVTGSRDSIVRAMALIENAVGSEKVYETLPSPPSSRLDDTPRANNETPQPVHVQPAPSEAKTKDSEANPRQLFPSGFLSGENTNGLSGTLPPGIHATTHPGFDAATTNVDSTTDIPSQLPSEIGIRSNLQRETDGSVSSLNDRSHSSRTLLQQSFPLPENDPLLQFLRSQASCIKGNVDEFFTWLVKSEDVDTIAALKEAVSDEEYLSDTMKNGNGTVGLKGFKVRLGP